MCGKIRNINNYDEHKEKRVIRLAVDSFNVVKWVYPLLIFKQSACCTGILDLLKNVCYDNIEGKN